jgi:hypothetical protein
MSGNALMAAQEDAEKLQQFKSKFNEDVVSSLTGLTGEALGRFMANLRALKKHTLVDWVIASTAADIADFITGAYVTGVELNAMRRRMAIHDPSGKQEIHESSLTPLPELIFGNCRWDPELTTVVPIGRDHKEGEQK